VVGCSGSSQKLLIEEGYQDVPAAVLANIKLYLNDIQYLKGKSLVAFYVALALIRTRRLRTDADTRLQKDINAELVAQVKERSRWDSFEVWVKSCSETQGTGFEFNYLERTKALPDDPLLYIRFVNTLGTLLREELAYLKKEQPPAWKREEIDDGTARENYEPLPAKPTAVNAEMEKYLAAHYKTIVSIWPGVEKKAVGLKSQLDQIEPLLAVKERAPNGFTIRSYVLFEEKNFMKPMAEVLKFILDALALSLQYDDKGKKIFSIDEANILAGQRMIKESGVDFSSWFVPYVQHMTGVKKLSYKERFSLMTFNPQDYNKLLGSSYLFLKKTLDQLKNSIQPMNKAGAAASEGFDNFGGHVDDLPFAVAPFDEGFIGMASTGTFETASIGNFGTPFAGIGKGAPKPATQDEPGTEEENKPLEGKTKEVLYIRFALLNQLEPDFSAGLPMVNKIIAEYKQFKKDIEDGKYTFKEPTKK
jgi:hypothetical protein